MKKNKEVFDYFLIAIFTMTLPLLKSTIYIPEMLSLFYSILISVTLVKISRLIKNMKLQASFLIAILILQIFIGVLFQVWQPGYINPRKNELGRTLNEQNILLSEYINDNIKLNLIANNELDSIRLASLTYCKVIYSSHSAVACDYMNSSDFQIEFAHNKKGFKSWLSSPFNIVGWQFDYYLEWLKQKAPYTHRDVHKLFSRYGINYYVINILEPENGALYKSVKKDSNLIYTNGEHQLWDIK